MIARIENFLWWVFVKKNYPCWSNYVSNLSVGVIILQPSYANLVKQNLIRLNILPLYIQLTHPHFNTIIINIIIVIFNISWLALYTDEEVLFVSSHFDVKKKSFWKYEYYTFCPKFLFLFFSSVQIESTFQLPLFVFLLFCLKVNECVCVCVCTRLCARQACV